MKKLAIVAITVSVVLNILLGYAFLKTFVYNAGMQQGLVQADQQVQQFIKEGKLLVPNQIQNGDQK